jgi:hypothetical protein
MPRKKPVVKFLYPSIPVMALEKGEHYTLFHRRVTGLDMPHDDDNEECWCSPIVMRDSDVPLDYTYDDYIKIVATPVH